MSYRHHGLTSVLHMDHSAKWTVHIIHVSDKWQSIPPACGLIFTWGSSTLDHVYATLTSPFWSLRPYFPASPAYLIPVVDKKDQTIRKKLSVWTDETADNILAVYREHVPVSEVIFLLTFFTNHCHSRVFPSAWRQPSSSRYLQTLQCHVYTTTAT